MDPEDWIPGDAQTLRDVRRNERNRVLDEVKAKFDAFWSEEAIKHDYAFHPSLFYRLIEEMRNDT
jgi:hypothetical protein